MAMLIHLCIVYGCLHLQQQSGTIVIRRFSTTWEVRVSNPRFIQRSTVIAIDTMLPGSTEYLLSCPL